MSLFIFSPLLVEMLLQLVLPGAFETLWTLARRAEAVRTLLERGPVDRRLSFFSRTRTGLDINNLDFSVVTGSNNPPEPNLDDDLRLTAARERERESKFGL